MYHPFIKVICAGLLGYKGYCYLSCAGAFPLTSLMKVIYAPVYVSSQFTDFIRISELLYYEELTVCQSAEYRLAGPDSCKHLSYFMEKNISCFFSIETAEGGIFRIYTLIRAKSLLFC